MLSIHFSRSVSSRAPKWVLLAISAMMERLRDCLETSKTARSMLSVRELMLSAFICVYLRLRYLCRDYAKISRKNH